MHRTITAQIAWYKLIRSTNSTLQDPKTKKITDFFSFYALESSVIGNKKHDLIRAAYLFYYATEAAFDTSEDPKKVLKTRLNDLMNDALILAKKVCWLCFPLIGVPLTRSSSTSTCSTLSPCSITTSSSSNRSSVPATGNSTTISSTGEQSTSTAASMNTTGLMMRSVVKLDW